MTAERMRRVALLLHKEVGADDMELIRAGISQIRRSPVLDDSGDEDCDKLRNIAQRIRETEILIRAPAHICDNESSRSVQG